MTIVRLGYVAMSMQLQNSSPSQTMTYAQFSKIPDKEAAVRKLERIARSNLANCLRLLKHNHANDISFFRLSSRLIPLANHEELEGWNYLAPLTEILNEIGDYIAKHKMRIDFHPDHFVLLNSPKKDILKTSVVTLGMHVKLLKEMGIDPDQRCVIHIGGAYQDREKALERFIYNWMFVPYEIQKSIMLENDDTTFHLSDTLFLCEKLGIPLVFDYHHHLAHHKNQNWEEDWERVVKTWSQSSLPIKMHISSPKSEKEFRSHADYIDPGMFFDFLHAIKGSVRQVDCMIEAKRKDEALFHLMENIKKRNDIELLNESSFRLI
ncbi:UV DNA damage repair endonuclease UvsE [Pseudalkalibacillus caeni]|uniref:UV DNA damage repair endonuclease UvsE n=1 Tax=Exobacillus caeni TaxID=2574798 RepID=A0A5R9F209_9BACL|nr:UV DNA damage repair endonuclease UvsE [Pseudalkalibacillus caeni]TLS34943.1 UV DNA damage repair endonuclease UvsE [Pseudalkalibacillus caeni]